MRVGCLGELNLLNPLANLIVSLPRHMLSVYKRRQTFRVRPTGELPLPPFISYIKAQFPEAGLRIALPRSLLLLPSCKLPERSPTPCSPLLESARSHVPVHYSASQHHSLSGDNTRFHDWVNAGSSPPHFNPSLDGKARFRGTFLDGIPLTFSIERVLSYVLFPSCSNSGYRPFHGLGHSDSMSTCASWPFLVPTPRVHAHLRELPVFHSARSPLLSRLLRRPYNLHRPHEWSRNNVKDANSMAHSVHPSRVRPDAFLMQLIVTDP